MTEAEAVVGGFLAAVGERDLERARTFWADDAIWHITGTNELAGEYDPDRYLARLAQWFDDYPDYAVEPTDFRAHGRQGLAVHMRTRKGMAPGEASGLLVYRVQDGRIAEGWAIATFADGTYPF